MRIHKYGSKVLRKVSNNVDNRLPIYDYIYSMEGYFIKSKSKSKVRGISCPQIGALNRMFIINIDGISKVFINPTIEYIGDDKISSDETCLSIPGVIVNVERYSNIRVTYFNTEWEEITNEFSGDVSICIQKQIDYLNGVFIIDYLSDDELKKLGKTLNNLTMSKDEYIESESRSIYGSAPRGSFTAGASFGSLYSRYGSPNGEISSEPIYADLGEPMLDDVFGNGDDVFEDIDPNIFDETSDEDTSSI